MRGVLAILALCAFAASAAEMRTGTFSPPRLAPDFTLQGSNGADLRLSSYRGKVVALGFGYTHCPDVCPTTLADLAQARRELGAAASDFQVIYVTVDPERDTAKRLQQYVTAFDPGFLGATGTAQQLGEVRKAYGIQALRKENPDKPSQYSVHHSSYVYLVDRSGNLRAMMPFGVALDDVVHDVKTLLAAAPAGPDVKVVEAWARATPTTEGGNAAVYARLVNAGSEPDELVAVSGEVSGAAELHESYSRFGMMMMRKVADVKVPAGGEAALKPGGFHIMLVDLKRPLKAGETLQMSFQFRKAGRVPVMVQVK